MTTSLVSRGDVNSATRQLPHEVFINVLSFLELQDLGVSARVCKSWNKHVESEDQWKIQCPNRLGLSPETDPKSDVQQTSSRYVWICIPSLIENDFEDFILSKIDNPNDEEAPRFAKEKLVLRKSICRMRGESTSYF
jgi:hypothetical protein